MLNGRVTFKKERIVKKLLYKLTSLLIRLSILTTTILFPVTLYFVGYNLVKGKILTSLLCSILLFVLCECNIRLQGR